MVVGKEAAQTPSRLRVFSSTPDATTCHPEFSKPTIHNNKTSRRKLVLNKNSCLYSNQLWLSLESWRGPVWTSRCHMEGFKIASWKFYLKSSKVTLSKIVPFIIFKCSNWSIHLSRINHREIWAHLNALDLYTYQIHPITIVNSSFS